ncbi:cadherin-like beta sandwich domain-containing protein [Cohnella suwonensis]|uniref:Cadherin-like beta sandwich domain-containing protein n=1 Tax=Cohnella suwonensis TaxID=696072 RepID=A0ABW0LZQ6_9BACL
MKKSIMYLLSFLVLIIPLFGSVGNNASAASSRVAVIKEMKGIVKVKKAGGSKEFTAFAKMSLSEGDILTVGTNGSAVLAFANGTSEDDRMTVSANSTLTFSKLSNSKGTTTKVSLYNGKAWVDVKSISSKDDEFTLETPTAIMGVRGTHLLVTVDPVSGATHLTVAAGVVNTKTSDPSHPDEKDVYPTQNALITKDEQEQSEVTIAAADVELLMKQSDGNIAGAILKAAGEIRLENDRKMDQYLDELAPPNNEPEKDRVKTNVESILGAIAEQALNSGLITQTRLNEILAEVKSQSGADIDLNKKTITLSDEEKRAQEEQRKKDEESSRRALEQKEKEEQERQQQLADQLEKARKEKEEKNKQALQDQNKKSLEQYEQQLSEADKKRFQEDAAKISQQPQTGGSGSATSSATPSETSTSSSDPSQTNAALATLTVKRDIGDGYWSDVPISFESGTLEYVVPFESTYTKIQAQPSAVGASIESIKLGGVAIAPEDGGYYFYNSGNNVVTVTVLAPDHVTKKTYTLKFYRPAYVSGITSLTNDKNILWQYRGFYQYGQTDTPVNAMKLSLAFEPDVGYAEITYEDKDGISQTIKSNAENEINLVNLKLNAYLTFQLKLFDTSVEPMSIRQDELRLMNGVPNFDVDHPIDLAIATASSPPIEYAEETENDHYVAQVDNWRDQARVLDEYTASYSDVLYSDKLPVVPLFVFDEQQSKLIDMSNMYEDHMQLKVGNNEFTVYVTDPSGRYFHSYSLSIFRKTAPFPLSDWSLKNGLDVYYFTPVEGVGSRHYADVPSGVSNVNFNMKWIQGLEESILSYALKNSVGTEIKSGVSGASGIGELNQALALNTGMNKFTLVLNLPNNETYEYQLCITRGDPPPISLGTIELLQSSTAIAVVSSGDDTFTATVNDNTNMLNNFTLRFPDLDDNDVFVYAPGYVTPMEGGYYSFNNLNPGIKEIEVIVYDLTNREYKEFTILIKYNVSNADLGSLLLEKYSSSWTSIDYGYISSDTSYDFGLGEAYFNTRLSAVPAVSGATVKVKVDDGSYSTVSMPYVFDASTVYTKVQVEVTAIDGITKKTYELILRRPIPDGLAEWFSKDALQIPVKWTLYGTSGSTGLYEVYPSANGTLDMTFQFTTGTPSTRQVVITLLSGVISDKYHVTSGTSTTTKWASDNAGMIQINGIPTGSSYYKLQVFDTSGGSPVQIGSDHYLAIFNTTI